MKNLTKIAIAFAFAVATPITLAYLDNAQVQTNLERTIEGNRRSGSAFNDKNVAVMYNDGVSRSLSQVEYNCLPEGYN